MDEFEVTDSSGTGGRPELRDVDSSGDDVTAPDVVVEELEMKGTW
ncbi:hypothetical protein ACFQHN_10340 [Natrialbaceae archaeon GCM10025896]